MRPVPAQPPQLVFCMMLNGTSGGLASGTHLTRYRINQSNQWEQEMTFVESIKTCFSKYADFEGRASRSEYWWWFLFTLLVSAASGMVSEMVSGLFSLAVLLPSLAVGVRRLHDTDRSGWFMLLWIIPILGWIPLIVWAVQEGKEPNRFSSAK